MKPLLYLTCAIGLVVLGAFGDNIELSDSIESTDENEDEKRFSHTGSNTQTFGKDPSLVNWSSVFKRISGRDNKVSFGADDSTYVDWSKMFKRLQFEDDPNNVDYKNSLGWHEPLAKRFGNGMNTASQDLVDWSDAFQKRFGSNNYDDPTMVDWSEAFIQKKRSKRSTGFKRPMEGMYFSPNELRSGDLVDWSSMFTKRAFGDFVNERPTLQDWRYLIKKRFGSSYTRPFGQNDQDPLQDWRLYRRRRSVV